MMRWHGWKRMDLPFLLQPLEHHFCVLPLEVAMDTPLLGDLRGLISCHDQLMTGLKRKGQNASVSWGVAGELPKGRAKHSRGGCGFAGCFGFC